MCCGGQKLTDKDIFCEQVRLNEKAAYQLAFSIVRNDADAADILSEAILRAYSNFDKLKNTQSFRTWLLRIVHNTAVEFVRNASKTVSLEDDTTILTDNGEGRLLTSLALRETVNRLKAPYSTVVILYYYEDMSISQIAGITSTSVVTVKQRLSRARKQLRELLKEDFHDE